MNTTIKTIKLATLLTGALLTLPYLSAQSTDTNGPTASNTSCPRPWHHDGQFKAILTPAEHQELVAARKSAFSQDPSLEQNLKAAEEAMKSAHEAVKAAMVKADPNVEAILQKLEAARPPRHEEGSAPTTNQPTTAN